MNPFMTEILYNNFGTAADICHPDSDRYWTYDEGTTFIDPYGPIYFDSVNERKFKEFAIMLNPDDSNKHNCRISATYISNNLSRCIRQVVYKNTEDKINSLNEKIDLSTTHESNLDSKISSAIYHEEILGNKEKVSITYKNLYNEVEKGTIILINDGLIKIRLRNSINVFDIWEFFRLF